MKHIRMLFIIFIPLIICPIYAQIADSFWIEMATSTPAGSENIRLKSQNIPGGIYGDFYVMYRAQWALFNWDDVMNCSGSDSSHMIDPIEDQFTFFDQGQYRWTSGNLTFDFFRDTLWNDVGACSYNTLGRKGPRDPRINWFYTIASVDSNETTGELEFSPTVVHPVAEYDQWLGNSRAGRQNIISFAIYHLEIADSGYRASAFARVLVPHCQSISQWNRMMERWETLLGSDIMKLRNVYRIILDSLVCPSDTFIMSLYKEGYVPIDTCNFLYKLPTRSSGRNYVMMPYQEYNIIMNVPGRSFPIRASWVGEDIEDVGPGISPYVISRFNPFSQRYELLAIKAGANWINFGYVYPGQPIVITIRGTGGNWPPCP